MYYYCSLNELCFNEAEATYAGVHLIHWRGVGMEPQSVCYVGILVVGFPSSKEVVG